VTDPAGCVDTLRGDETGRAGDWFDSLPKVELHLHLEGAIPVPALWELLGKYGGRDETPTLEALEGRFRYTDFGHFLEVWTWKNRFLRELEDFTFIAEAVARDLRAQKILYVEAFYSPSDFARYSLGVGELTTALRRGLDRVDGITVNLVADMVRDRGPERALRTLAAVAEVRDLGVIGIGLGGSEHRFPPEPFAPVYERGRQLGFRTTAHAGEAAGAASVRGALHVLRVGRIGHGTRAVEDPALLDLLAERRIPLEMCPISNVRTGVVPSLAAHPVVELSRRGLLVTVNTDDPAMFQTSLADEYRQLSWVHDLTRDEVRRLVDVAVEASWLGEVEKASLRERVHGDPGWWG
jgi:adenosine deaminase